jgi:transposase
MIAKKTNRQDWRKYRRLQAWKLKRHGWRQGAIAEALGVSPAAVSQWLSAVRRRGPAALEARCSPGRPGKLTPDQKRLIPDFLWHGAEAYGFRGQVWTCARVAQVIQREFGIPYHRGHVSRLLKELDWTPRTPVVRALQRDEVEIERWRIEVWPELRARARRERRALVFVDESGFYLLPGVVRTYGPRGERSVIWEKQTRDHLSVMSGVTPQGKLYTLVRDYPLTGLESVLFLEHLLHQTKRKLLVIWDRSPIHRCQEVKQFLSAGSAGRVHLEPLPPYAPDLNPAEGAWQHLKNVELRNLCCLDLEELHLELCLAVGRLRRKPHIIQSFFAEAELNLQYH